MLPDKPAERSVTMWGLALILVGAFIPLLGTVFCLPVTDEQLKDVRVEVIGAGVALAGVGYRRTLGAVKKFGGNGNGTQQTTDRDVQVVRGGDPLGAQPEQQEHADRRGSESEG